MKNEQIEDAESKDLFLLDEGAQKLIRDVERFFSKLPMGHSAYQIEHFIIGQFITPDRKHRQCLQELHKRFRGVLQFHYDYRKSEVEIERLKLKIEVAQSACKDNQDLFLIREKELDIKDAEIDLEQKAWSQMMLKRSLKEILREMVIFKEQMDSLESGRKHDNYEDAEPEYWEKQYANLRLQGKTGENLPLIPEDVRIECEREIKRTLGSMSLKMLKR